MTNTNSYIGSSWTGTQPTTYTMTPFNKAPISHGTPRRRSRLRRSLRDLGLRLASERGGALPAMGGGSPEGETVRKTEHRKKITLDRKVGVPRDKGSGMEEIHQGKLTLVRSLEGDANQLSTIGLKTEPNGGTYVEIPIGELLDAVKDLRDTPVTDTSKKGKGR